MFESGGVGQVVPVVDAALVRRWREQLTAGVVGGLSDAERVEVLGALEELGPGGSGNGGPP